MTTIVPLVPIRPQDGNGHVPKTAEDVQSATLSAYVITATLYEQLIRAHTDKTDRGHRYCAVSAYDRLREHIEVLRASLGE